MEEASSLSRKRAEEDSRLKCDEMDKKCQPMSKEIGEERKRFEEEKLKFEEQKATIESNPENFKTCVKLNVGGQCFEITLSTLHTGGGADNMLAAIFSGRHELVKGEDNAVFIDRDPTWFGLILNYMRGASIQIPENKAAASVLKDQFKRGRNDVFLFA